MTTKKILCWLFLAFCLSAQAQPEDVEALLQRAFETHGGDALRAVRTYQDEGEFVGSTGNLLNYKTYFDFNKGQARIEFYQDGQIVVAQQLIANKAKIWTPQTGVTPLPAAQGGEDLRRTLSQSVFNLREGVTGFGRITDKGKQTWNDLTGRAVEVVHNGFATTLLLAEDGTLLGERYVSAAAGETTVLYRDYKIVANIKFPSVGDIYGSDMSTRVGSQEVSDVRVNEKLTAAFSPLELLAEAPERVVETTVLDTDKTFDEGSGITARSLTKIQIENLAVLGKVWGFLKYHHPRVAAGELHWDYELFRVLPDVLEADSIAARNRVLSRWVTQLGVPKRCDPCASTPENVQLRPRLAWLKDAKQLGPKLSRQLQTIYQHRFVGDAQFYVSLEPNVRNPRFDHELSYADPRLPDPGFRILALLRYWNIIEYWFPYRNQIDGSWDAVLREFLPRIVAADAPDAYRLTLFALVTRVQDTHANLWSELGARPPHGTCRWPVALRFIEGRATVTSLLRKKQSGGLEVGDVVTQLDGQRVESLIEAWSPYYSASNETRRLADIAQNLPQGNCGKSKVVAVRQGKTQTLTPKRLNGLDETPPAHDRPGETFQLLSPDVAYLKLSSVRVADVNSYLSQAAGTQGFIIDIRNYPAEFIVFDLGSHFVQKPTPFARFTLGNVTNPGTFTWFGSISLTPDAPFYKGKIVILVDESSLSQAEYTALAFRAAPNAVVIGSTTAGADGNVSDIPLPGGVQTLMSGIGVFYPDKRPTQQVGIVPDIVAAPTLKGIREGRDEVLERALRYVLGSEVKGSEIRQLAE